MVLLKNNAILPLDKSKLKNVAVIGPNANSIVPLNGNYHGTANQYFTVLESIREALPQVRVNYTKGSHLYEHKLEDPGYEGDCFADVKAQVDLADVVILVVGMDETIEGEEILNNDNFTGDKNDLLLPETQRNLIKTVCERKTPVIVVNMTGSAVDFGYGNNAEAIVQAWYPGAMGGKALSDLIFGEYSPSGRLPVTFYKNENSLPDFEDYTMDGRTYKFIKEQPLYPFGYGLSYTSFEYDNIKISEKTHKPGDSIKCSVKVTNTGHMVGDEVVQCYLKDIDSSYRQPVHKLCGMKRVLLIPGEDKKVKFEIDWQQFLSVNEEGDCVFEPGKFRIYIGGSQPDGYSQSLMGSKCSQAEITID